MSESICGLRRGNIQKINCYDPATFDKLCPEPPQPQRRFGTAAQSRISNDTQGKSQCATKDADLPRVNKSAIVSPSEYDVQQDRATVDASRNSRGDCDQHTSREIAPCASAFPFSNGRSVIRSARRLPIYSLAEDRHLSSHIDFSLAYRY